jgi:acetoin:2,6-dichlorophenolindophenol oxidoreductase subunit alpha
MAVAPEERSSTGASDLGPLADPGRPLAPLDVARFSPAWLQRAFSDMTLIRLAEEAIGALVEQGIARAPCHLGIGQEAVAVGVASQLRRTDRVFGGHRSHSHYLALGGDLYELIAEVLGKADGASRGMGGSMHLFAQSVGFYGSVPIVGATIPIAVGAALAAKFDGAGDVAVAFFGDGATEEGVFHESMNLAAAQQLPVLFVCENNLFSSHLDIALRQPSDRIARYAEAHRVRAATVDGNDLAAVTRATESLVASARAGGGPGFLEAITYRHRGHVGPKEDIDVGVRRKMSDLTAWKRLDPIRRLREALVAAGLATAAKLDAEERALRAKVQAACERAKAAPYPPTEALLGAVFAGKGRE